VDKEAVKKEKES